MTRSVVRLVRGVACGVVLSLVGVAASAGPAWGPPGWPNQPIDGGHPPPPKLKLAEAGGAGGPEPSMADLSARLKAIQLTASDSLKAMTVASEDASPKLKEQKLWDQQVPALAERLKTLETAEADNNAAMGPLNVKIRQWNADCAGHPLTNAEAATCDDRARLLQREKAPLDQRKADIEGQALAVQRQFNSIHARWEALDGQVNGLHSQYDAARARYAASIAEIKQLQAIMRSRCDKRGSAEAMAYCGQVDWDGARLGLPPLTNPPPPFGATRN